MTDQRRWLFWRWKTVSHNTYITRLDVLRTPWFEVKLHFMHGPDPERDPHDHPWPFLSLILRGQYVESRHLSWEGSYNNGQLIGVAQHSSVHVHHWFNWMPDPEQAHRITWCAPGTVTLVLALGRRREWGFHTRNGWVRWRDYKDA